MNHLDLVAVRIAQIGAEIPLYASRSSICLALPIPRTNPCLVQAGIEGLV